MGGVDQIGVNFSLKLISEKVHDCGYVCVRRLEICRRGAGEEEEEKREIIHMHYTGLFWLCLQLFILFWVLWAVLSHEPSFCSPSLPSLLPIEWPDYGIPSSNSAIRTLLHITDTLHKE